MENLFARIESLCEKKGIRPGRLCDELGLSRGLMTDLKMGRKKSVNAETTDHCRIKCAGCSANKLNGGKCDV